jgi:beta-mannanase
LVQQTVESLALLRHNLLHIVRYRQNSVAVLYVKYHKIMPKIIDDLSTTLIEQDINFYTFNNVELEIEGVLQLINSNVDYNQQMASEYNRILTWSEQEYNNVIQAYHSHYSKIVMTMRKAPWKYLFKIFNIGELELIY